MTENQDRVRRAIERNTTPTALMVWARNCLSVATLAGVVAYLLGPDEPNADLYVLLPWIGQLAARCAILEIRTGGET